MAVSKADEAALAAKFEVMRPFLGERAWRVYLGTEANALGYGGIAAVARASGASETTVAAGAAQARDPGAVEALAPGRSRRPGAGRPGAGDRQPGLARALEALLEEGRRGDPVSELTWSTLSLRDIAARMARLGFGCSKDTVARLMHAGGYSLQGMSRVLEGKQHEDRDLQFGNINAEITRASGDGEPVISVDGKKKEQLGPYHRAGRSWRRAGDPVQVRSHDFPDPDAVTICPYGIYDVAANRGFVSVGTSHDTAAFAVNAIRLWWQEEGSFRYPHAGRLLVTCDAGGSNGWRSRLWKDELARLAEETGLRIEVRHFPPGTSKWNKIEHRLFCHITRTWSARPLMSVEDAVAGIAATITSQGLKCHPVRDDRGYPLGVTVSSERMKYLQDRVIEPGSFHGEWNYAVLPAPRPGTPRPQTPPRRPARVPREVLNHHALTGIPAADLNALAAALDTRFEARLKQRNHLARGGERVNAVRSRAVHGNRRLAITDYLIALQLRDYLHLPARAAGVLLGVDGTTVSDVTIMARELLSAARITLTAAPPPDSPPRTPGELLAYAAAAGIPLTIPENRYTMPERFRTLRNRAARDTPEEAN